MTGVKTGMLAGGLERKRYRVIVRKKKKESIECDMRDMVRKIKLRIGYYYLIFLLVWITKQVMEILTGKLVCEND